MRHRDFLLGTTALVLTLGWLPPVQRKSHGMNVGDILSHADGTVRVVTNVYP